MYVYDYLESKGFDVECINKISKWYSNQNKVIDFKSFFDIRYDILEYAGLSRDNINKLLKNNVSILSFNNEDFLKLSYVLSETNYIDQIFDIEHGGTLSGIKKYKRIYTRNFVLNKAGLHLNGATMLLTSDYVKSYDTRVFVAKAAYNILGKYVSSDDELEKALDEYFLENYNVTVDQLLQKKSLEFFKKYFRYRRKITEKESSRIVK